MKNKSLVVAVDKDNFITSCNHDFCGLISSLVSDVKNITKVKFSDLVEYCLEDTNAKFFYLKNNKIFAVQHTFSLDNNQYYVGIDSDTNYFDKSFIDEKIQRTAGIGYVFFNLDNRELIISYQIYRLLGLDKDRKYTFENIVEHIRKQTGIDAHQLVDKLVSQRKVFDINTNLEKENGVSIWVRLIGSYQLNDDSKKISKIYLILQDVDMLKQIEIEMISQMENTKRILETIPEGVVLANYNGKITYINKHFSDIFGYELKEVIGKNVTCLMNEEHASKHDGYLENYHKTGSKNILNKGRNLYAVKKNGEEFPMYLCVGEMHSEGQSAFIGIIRDLTEERRLEEQQIAMQKEVFQARQLESVMTLAGGVAHDFNNALTAISGHVQLLEIKYLKDDAIMKHISQMKEVIQSATDITTSILQFSRKQEADFHPIELNSLLKKIGTHVLPELKENDEFIYDLHNEDCVVMGEAFILEQVFSNLYINALDAIRTNKHIDHAILKVTSKMEFLDDPASTCKGYYVIVTIEDNGCGIPDECIKKIYDPFFSTKEVGKGTGLGLAFVFNAVTKHKGIIKVSSTVNVGTKFTIYLPAVMNKQ